jgi:ElaB/YqjD/DUF883 family membrane-anchored ribosome-binding protein
METKEGTYPGRGDTPWSKVTPTTQGASETPTTPQASAPGDTATTGLERAGAYVKDAVDKTREKMVGYRDGGIEQVSQDIVEYARSQPKTALLIATGVGLMVGMLLTLGRK